MKYLFLILFITAPLLAQDELAVNKTDKDSLWQLINEVYTLETDVIVIKDVDEYGFVMAYNWKEYYCNTNTMPKEFWVKIKKRKQKLI